MLRKHLSKKHNYTVIGYFYTGLEVRFISLSIKSLRVKRFADATATGSSQQKYSTYLQ